MDLKVWLKSLGLEQYADAFTEHAVDMRILPRLGNDDLKEMGIAAVGHRRLLLDAISALQGEEQGEQEQWSIDEQSGERRQVSILFADLVGYSQLSAELDPEQVHEVLEAFFALADSAVVDYGGTVDKHIGDCVMGIFGAPVARGNDAERAVRAAVTIRDGAPGLSEKIGRDISAHIGVASGEVLAATAGSVRSEYTVTGQSVNLASRLADRAQIGEILISEAVHDAVRDLFAFEKASKFELKGFEDALTAWRVGEASTPARGHAQPFVGRVAEIRQFAAALDSCQATSSGQTIIVRGEPGIGKSRLLDEFCRMALDDGLLALAGMVLDFGGDNGRAAIASLVRGLTDVSLGSGGELGALMAEGGFEVAEQAMAIDLLDIPAPDEVRIVFEAMDSVARAHHTRRMIDRLLGMACQSGTVLLIVEDVHWAGTATLDILSTIAETIAELPVLLVLSTRIVGDPTAKHWAPSGRKLTLDLAPLGRSDATALARKHSGILDALILTCVERAAGNPLFLDQLLQHARAKSEGTVPDTVQSLVQARMDQLPSRDKRALQSASILGQTFTIDALRHLLEEPVYECSLLVQRNLLRHRDEDFIFTHALVRDAAYGSLPHGRRRDLHRKAADWLDGHDPVLSAEHLVLAEDPAAPRACLAAADLLVSRYRYEQALDLIERGLSLAQSSSQRVALELLRGDALLMSGTAQPAQETYAQAFDIATRPRERCRALIGLASARRITDDIDRAIADVDEALSIAQSERLIEEAARGFALRGNLLFPKGDIAGCCHAHEESVRFAREAGSAELEATALGGLGDAEYMRGHLVTACARYGECASMSARYELRRIEASNLPMKAITRFWAGNIREAREIAYDAVKAASRIGHERAQMIAHHAVYFACRQLMLLDEALDNAERSLEIARRLQAPRFEAEGLAFKAQIDADRGNVQTARTAFHEALAIGRTSGMAYMGPIFLGNCAQVATTESEIRNSVAEAEALLAAGSVSHNHLIFRRDIIDVCLRRGEYEDARYHAQALEDYARAEPTAYVDFIIDRARVLASCAEGIGEMQPQLERVAAEAERLGDLHALRGVKDAVEEVTSNT